VSDKALSSTHYDAITFDTQTVETNAFHFDGGLLAQMKQFKGGPVRVVVSEIVVREIIKHLVEKTKAAKDAALSAHKKAVDFGLSAMETPFVHDTVDVRAVARARLEGFLQGIGAEIIRSSNVPMSDLVEAYFRTAPPFSAAGKNKAEFPDAIALLSIERWAKDANARVLAVSNDKGWKAYSEPLQWIELRTELSDALALLQQHAEEANAAAQELLQSINNQVEGELARSFETMLQNALSGYDVYGEADSFYTIESDDVELELVEFSFVGDAGDYAISVVQSGPRLLAAEVDLEVSVRAETTFYMSIYDSIDRDYTPAGSRSATTEGNALDFKALVTFERDQDDVPFRLSKLELLDGPRSITFGFVEPDYEPEPEEDYEKPDDQPNDMDGDFPF
jgi:PIN domain